MPDRPLEADLEHSLAAARDTRARIAGFIRHTPLVTVASAGGGVRLLKLETLQRTGSFKVRGAAAALTAATRPRAVIAASTGNHGLAVAAVAGELELPCRVFVPAGAAGAKLERLRAGGVELVEVAGEPLLAELAAREAVEADAGALLVSPYNDRNVVLGQATLGLELLEDCAQPPQALFVAVGGGGLIGGVALAVRSRWPHCRIVGCVPAASPAMLEAVAAGHVVAAPVEPTLADATAGNLEEGSITVPLVAALVDEIVAIGEPEIAVAMRTALLDHHLVIEGAAALALAASLRREAPERDLIILSGGNVGGGTLREIL